MENITPPQTGSETHRPGAFPTCNACPAGFVPVEQRENGRFFITMGHAGFNVRANNGHGFKTAGAAMAAARRCGHGESDRAARSMDLTHAVGERGPRTFNARKRVARALDGIGKVNVADVRWLERVAAQSAR